MFPNLFQLAMNVLPAQGSAVSCERVFSSAKRTITDGRNRLAAGTVETRQILKYAFKSSRLSLQARWNTTLVEATALTIAKDLEVALKTRNMHDFERLIEELQTA